MIDLGTIAVTAATSVLCSVIASLVAFRLRFERNDGENGQRVKDWDQWRNGLEARLVAESTHLDSHEKECRERWERLLLEHGQVMGRLASIDDELRRQKGRR
jgi:hypothetical protein